MNTLLVVVVEKEVSNDTTQGLPSHRHHTVNISLVVVEKELSGDATQGLAGHRHETVNTSLVDVDLEKEVSSDAVSYTHLTLPTIVGV